MSKPQIHNVMKVADIFKNQLSAGCLEVIRNYEPAYADNHKDLAEHLFNIEEILEDITHPEDEDGIDTEGSIREELEVLLKVMGKKDCAYLRIVEF